MTWERFWKLFLQKESFTISIDRKGWYCKPPRVTQQCDGCIHTCIHTQPLIKGKCATITQGEPTQRASSCTVAFQAATVTLGGSPSCTSLPWEPTAKTFPVLGAKQPQPLSLTRFQFKSIPRHPALNSFQTLGQYYASFTSTPRVEMLS